MRGSRWDLSIASETPKKTRAATDPTRVRGSTDPGETRADALNCCAELAGRAEEMTIAAETRDQCVRGRRSGRQRRANSSLVG